MKIDPLRHNVPIVDARGFPKPEFIRQWQILLNTLAEQEERIRQLESTVSP